MADTPADGPGRSFEGLFLSLEAAYDAVVGREEDLAASDLALSLLQDRPLPRALTRSGPVAFVAGDGSSVPVAVVAADHVVLRDRFATLVRLSPGAVFVPGDGTPPRVSEEGFVQVMRLAVRDRREAVVETHAGVFRGPLLAAARDHLVLLGAAGQTFVGYPAVRWVRLDPSRTADGT